MATEVVGALLATNESNTNNQTLGGNAGETSNTSAETTYNLSSNGNVTLSNNNVDAVAALNSMVTNGLGAIAQTGENTASYGQQALAQLEPLLQSGQATNSGTSPLTIFAVLAVAGTLIYFSVK